MPRRLSVVTMVIFGISCCFGSGLLGCGGTTVKLESAEKVSKVDPSLPPGQQVFGAAMRGDLATLKALIDADASLVNAWDQASGKSVLHCAVDSNDEATVKYLLEKGADPYVIDNDEQTPLARAEEVRASEGVHAALLDAMKRMQQSGGQPS